MFVTAVIFFGSNLALAEVKPGDFIDSNNWEKVKNLLPESYVNEIKAGHYTMGISKPTYEPGHLKAYEEVTKKYAGKVKLSPKGGLIDYIGGTPFPNIEPSDPLAGNKIMWNFSWRCRGDDFTGDGVSLFFATDKYGNELMTGGNQYFMRPTARVSLDPKPSFPGYEKRGIEYFYQRASLYPRDASGTIVFIIRYFDPDLEDDMWIFIPSLRRVRRFSTAQRCSVVSPGDFNWDDYWGFDGKVPRFNHKLLEIKKALALMSQKHMPFKNKPGFWLPQDENYEKRSLYLVEETPKDKNYCYSKRIYWVDKASSWMCYSQVFDRKGEFWKMLQVPIMVYHIGGENIKYNTGVFMKDFQINHATKVSFPVKLNNGFDTQFFALSNLVSASRMLLKR